jgi:uncharacterized alpha-E superfamily protein
VQEFTWEPVVRIFAGSGSGDISKLGNNGREVMKFMVTGKENPNSILNIITLARENARGVQEHISKDLWQCLNEYYHKVKDPKWERALMREDPITVLDELIKQVMLYYGTLEITMERGEGRSFMNVGKYLERAIQSVDILDAKFGSASDNKELLTDTRADMSCILKRTVRDLKHPTCWSRWSLIMTFRARSSIRSCISSAILTG